MQPTPQQLQATGGKAVEGAWYGNQRFMGGQLLNPNQDQPGHNLDGSSSNSNSGGGGISMPSQPATPNLQSIYDENFTNNPAVIASNAKITDLQGKLTQRQQALDTATGNINDNPFYAEATRVGQVSKLNSEAQNDMNTINNQLTTEQNNLAKLQADAQYKVNLAQGQYSLDNQAWQQNLQEFNTILSAGGLEGASDATLAAMSVSTGIPQDMLKGVVNSSQAKNTQIVTSTDNAGNVTLTAVDATSGKIINTTTLAGVGAAKVGRGGSSGGGSAASDAAANYQTLIGDIKNGVTLKSLVNAYGVKGSGLTVNDIYTAYATHGSPNGAPKETLAQVKAGQFADMPGFTSKQKQAIK